MDFSVDDRISVKLGVKGDKINVLSSTGIITLDANDSQQYNNY